MTVLAWLLGCGGPLPTVPSPGSTPHTTPPPPVPVPTTDSSPPPPPTTLPVVDVAGVLFGDTVWSPDVALYYRVHGEVVVPVGASLRVLGGTEVRFDAEAALTVLGVMRAEGAEDARIAFGPDPDAAWVPDFDPSLPAGPPHWRGVHFGDSMSPENLLSFVDIDHAQSEDGAVGVVRSEAVLEHLTITGTRLRSVYSDSASVTVRYSVFPTMFAPEDSATELGLDNDAEYIKGIGAIPVGGHYVVEGNVFGVPKGHNDVIDVAGNAWPAEILEIRNNVFEGGGDDGIDGGGDILLDGNMFRSFVKDADNHGSGDSNCLSTADVTSTVVVATRNVFLDVDRVVNLKRGSFGYFEHNTVVGISPARDSLPGDNPPRVLPSSAIRLLIPNPTNPTGAAPRDPAGIGAQLDGNVFVDLPEVLFGNPDENGSLGPFTSSLAVTRTLVPSAAAFANSDGVHGRSFDYLVGTPVFVDPLAGDYALAAGSIGVGAGLHGLDLGADVPLGASVCCVTGPVASAVTLEVGGPGIFSFLWRVDGGPWSAEVPITDPRAYVTVQPVPRTAPLTLSGLAAGARTLEVQGRDFAGALQPVTALTLTVL